MVYVFVLPCKTICLHPAIRSPGLINQEEASLFLIRLSEGGFTPTKEEI
jgi:hypothetical protein